MLKTNKKKTSWNLLLTLYASKNNMQRILYSACLLSSEAQIFWRKHKPVIHYHYPKTTTLIRFFLSITSLRAVSFGPRSLFSVPCFLCIDRTFPSVHLVYVFTFQTHPSFQSDNFLQNRDCSIAGLGLVLLDCHAYTLLLISCTKWVVSTFLPVQWLNKAINTR